MAYGNVGMTPKKNGGHIKSAQMTRSKCLHRSVNGFHEPYQALSSTSMGNRTVNLLESIAEVPDRCQVNIGIPKNTHPGSPYSREYRHPDVYIYVNTGTRVPIFTVNMGIPL